jgi:hypothetical protein
MYKLKISLELLLYLCLLVLYAGVVRSMLV